MELLTILLRVSWLLVSLLLACGNDFVKCQSPFDIESQTSKTTMTTLATTEASTGSDPDSNCNETSGECVRICDGSCTPAPKWSCSAEGEYIYVALEDDIGQQVIHVIIYLGFSVSLVACIVANFLYLITRESLGSVGSSYHVHWHLIASFTFYHIVFLVDYSVLPSCYVTSVELRNVLNVLLVYTVLANFFWMLVEGVILFCIVSLSFFGDQTPKQFVKWLLLGWGTPAVLVCVWVAVERATLPSHCTVFELKSSSLKNTVAGIVCVIAPVFATLLINGVILIIVMRSIAKKISFQARGEIKRHRQTAKSTLVLLVLLGTYYIPPLVVAQFKSLPCLLVLIVSSSCNVISSLQGLAVSTLFVFCNAHVRDQIRSTLSKRFSRDFWSRFNTSSSTSSPAASKHSNSLSSSKRHSSSLGERKPNPEIIEMNEQDNNVELGEDGYARLETNDPDNV